MGSLFSLLHLRSLRVQVFLWTIAPLIVLLILFSLTGVGAHQASMRQLAAQENARMVDVMAGALASQVDNKTASVQAAAQLLAHDFADPAMRASHFQAAREMLAGLDLALVDARGNPVDGAAPSWLAEMGPEFLAGPGEESPMMLVEHGADGARAVWRVPVPGAPVALMAGEPITSVVESGGVDLPASSFGAGYVSGHGSEHGGALVLTDGAGRALFTQGDEVDQALAAAVNAPDAAGAYFVTTDGNEYAVAYAAVEGAGWRLLLREPWHGLATPPILLQQMMPFVVLIAVMVSLLTLLFGLLLVVRPLRRLSEQTRLIGQGNFAAAAEGVGGVDEIEELRLAVDQMAQQIDGYQAGVRSYLHAVTRAQEEERARLARELHDDTIQTLTALDHKVQKLQRTLEREPAELAPHLDELHRMVAGATAEVRRFSRALRPLYLEDLGLEPALQRLTQDAGVELTVAGTPRRLAPDVELALYRIAQESLSNARRHAQAEQVAVTLAFAPAQVRLTVSDDGAGFDLPPNLSTLANTGHFGLMSMQERADLAGAQISIDTAPGQGTTITVVAPAVADPRALPVSSAPV